MTWRIPKNQDRTLHQLNPFLLWQRVAGSCCPPLPSTPIPSLPFSDILLPWNVECGGVVVYLQRWSFCAVKNVPDGMSHEMERAESSLQDDSADRAIYRVGLERANLQTVPCKGNLLTLPLTRVVLLAEQAGTSLLLANTDQRSPVVRLSVRDSRRDETLLQKNDIERERRVKRRERTSRGQH